jgi:hypothetical protein
MRPRGRRLLCCSVCVLIGLGATMAAAEDLDYGQQVAALARQLETAPRNAALSRAWMAERARVGRDPAAARLRLAQDLDAQGLLLRRVPGLLYRRYPETGADLAALAGWLGVPVLLVATDELGTVEANADLVASELRGGQASGRSVVFSASKGSAEVRSALESDPALGERVPIWIDLVGVLEGTPLLNRDAELAGETAWLPPAVARSLSSEVRREAIAPSGFPVETRAVHVAAFPRASDVSERARRSFGWLRGLGPNDGYVLLDAYLRAPGRVLIEHGVDHYLSAATDLDEKLLALLRVLVAELASGPLGEEPGGPR